jgi:hypothetical protein
MDLIADILLVAGAFAAAAYCAVLSRRLRRLQTLEGGMGGAIAVLSAQVDDLTRALEVAKGAASGQVDALARLTQRGEAAAARLELMLAAMHDMPQEAAPPAANHDEPVDFIARSEASGRTRVLRRRAHRPAAEAAE